MCARAHVVMVTVAKNVEQREDAHLFRREIVLGVQEKEYAQQQLQQLLKKIFKDPAERTRILRQTSLDNSTVSRWLNGDTRPRPASLRLILEHCSPDDQKVLAELIDVITKDGAPSLSEFAIPSTFYSRVLLTLAETPHSLRFSAIGHLILQQAAQQLDPMRMGMDMTLLRCVHTPRGVRCLQESLRLRKTPASQSSLYYFSGLESLAGYAVSSFQIAVNKQGVYYTLTQEEVYDVTAIAVPILREGCIGGCLLIEVPFSRDLMSEELTLIKDYALVIALAFDPKYFFERSALRFIIAPPKETQTSLLLSVHERKLALMRSQDLDSTEADLQVTQQIIDDLATLANDPSR